eukprot:g26572.t1
MDRELVGRQEAYINDLDQRIEYNISKFADDTKQSGSVGCEEDANRLHSDFDRLAEWANTWQMQYNIDKCEVIHFGKNREADYYLNGGSLGKGEVQEDLDVMVEQLLEVGMQVQQVVRKTNDMLAFIARGFEYRSSDVLLRLYRALKVVGPNLLDVFKRQLVVALVDKGIKGPWRTKLQAVANE